MGNEEGNCNPLQCKESEKEYILNHFSIFETKYWKSTVLQ